MAAITSIDVQSLASQLDGAVALLREEIQKISSASQVIQQHPIAASVDI